MTSTIRIQQGLTITAEGEVIAMTYTGEDSIREAIGCRAFDVISGEGRIDVWVDDEGLLVLQPEFNLAATLLVHELGVQTAIFGTAVVLGVDPETGETLGLTVAQSTRTHRIVANPAATTRIAVGRTLHQLLSPQ